MDRCCQSQLVAEAVGQVERISDETAEMTKGQVGSEIAFWLSYQPIYDLMLQKDDSFFILIQEYKNKVMFLAVAMNNSQLQH